MPKDINTLIREESLDLADELLMCCSCDATISNEDLELLENTLKNVLKTNII
tara:strand:+ start:2003 stop:2158 length:156 start_codon:yes stop_codon:yes gene_type:complete